MPTSTNPQADPDAHDGGQVLPAPEACRPSHTYNHDLLRQHGDQDACRREFPLTAPVLIDLALLKVFAPLEEAARRYKKLVKWLGTLAIAMMVLAFSGAIAGVYGVALGKPMLPH